MLSHFERALNESERVDIEARVARLRRAGGWGWRTSLLGSGAVCAPLMLFTLAVSDAPRVLVVLFWVAVGAVLAVWVARSARSGVARQLTLLERALEGGRVRGTRVQSARVVEFQEIEDEGACYAFEVGDGRVFFVLGQEFYESATFPNDDFSLIELVTAAGEVVDGFWRANGERLAPERVVSRAVKNTWVIPEHMSTVSAVLDDIEQQLPRRTP